GYMKNVTGARAIVFSLILSSIKNTEKDDVIEEFVDVECREIIGDVIEKTGNLEKRQWLPLIDILLPVLKSMSVNRKQEFIRAVDAMVKVDKRITVFEFVLLIIMRQHLSNHSAKIDVIKYHSFKHVTEDVRVIISLLVQAGKQAVEKKDQVFIRAMRTFISHDVAMYPAEDCNLEKLTNVMKRLNALAPMLKKTLITVCADCVLDDGIVLAPEAELLRAISESLDCPMPPLVTD
ncbi:MAG: hypothetical protein OEZ38_03000, partial [Gammaproteobacteria bacterium]|nr:hypothetical protein [Gammaproteobacteria bacterium]